MIWFWKVMKKSFRRLLGRISDFHRWQRHLVDKWHTARIENSCGLWFRRPFNCDVSANRLFISFLFPRENIKTSLSLSKPIFKWTPVDIYQKITEEFQVYNMRLKRIYNGNYLEWILCKAEKFFGEWWIQAQTPSHPCSCLTQSLHPLPLHIHDHRHRFTVEVSVRHFPLWSLPITRCLRIWKCIYGWMDGWLYQRGEGRRELDECVWTKR